MNFVAVPASEPNRVQVCSIAAFVRPGEEGEADE
jgi:hypothetical protein